MSATSTSVFNALSMTDSGLFSISSAFAAKSPFTTLSIPARAAKLHLSCAHSSSLSPSLSLKKKPQFTSIFTRAAEEESTITLEQEEGSEVQVSDWEGDGGDSAGEEPIGVAEEAADAEPSEDAKIFVANIPYDVDSEQLATLFQNVGQVEVAEIVYNRETDRSRGFGFVTMSTVEEAENAIEKFNRYEWDGRVLVVNKASKRGERIERPPRTFAPAFKIFVANMSWDMDDSRLEQIFSEHGQVENARVVLDRETGRSRGFGFVTMSSETEMNNAIAALDGQTLDGRSIRVTVAEQRPRRS